ncbi:hypothetical protein GJAV_G00103590 [Gymnothorax javanicus]|nr:hypothetical protein GJAV_G00103590 [Gymnothorax javanicus]
MSLSSTVWPLEQLEKGARTSHIIQILRTYISAVVPGQAAAPGIKMGSNAAAAISTMIISQAYPNLTYPLPPRAVSRHRRAEPEVETAVPGMSAKGIGQMIGCFQIFLGICVLATLLTTIIAHAVTLPSVLMSLTSGILYITCGVSSSGRCGAGVKRRRLVVRAAVITSVLAGLAALSSVVIYSIGFGGWQDMFCSSAYYCRYERDPMLFLIISLVLSILALGFAVLMTILSWNDLSNIDDLDLVAFSQEGWRDGESGDDNGKMLRDTSSSISV